MILVPGSLRLHQLGRSFWVGFAARNPSISRKINRRVDVLRARNSTHAVTQRLFEARREALIRGGIMNAATGEVDGRRVFGTDEMPAPHGGKLLSIGTD